MSDHCRSGLRFGNHRTTGAMIRMLVAAMAWCLLTGVAWNLLAGPGLSQDRPNILWISSEDNGPQLGCYGDAYSTTPNLDGLASRGMRYQRAWSCAPVCAPARTTIITEYGPHRPVPCICEAKSRFLKPFAYFRNTFGNLATTARTTSRKITTSRKQERFGMSPAIKLIGAIELQDNHSFLSSILR